MSKFPSLKLKKRNVEEISRDPEDEKNFPRGRGKGWSTGFQALNAFERHKQYINNYIIHYKQKDEYVKPKSTPKTDYDILKSEYRFIRTEEDDEEETWEKKFAKKYYDRLFKEYVLADMSRYKENKFGFRWRTEKEVFDGKGHFICGNKACNATNDLQSFEVPFTYKEAGERKSALVKLRVCPTCSQKLNYHRIKKEEEGTKRKKFEEKDPFLKKEEQLEGGRVFIKEELDEQKEKEKISEIWKNDKNNQNYSQITQKSEVDQYEKYFEGMFL